MKRSFLLCAASLIILAGCNEKAEYSCGNGKLEDNETCDGSLIRDEIHVICSNGNSAKKADLSCTSDCRLDTTQACQSTCGNGLIEGDEQCDGIVPYVFAGCDNPDMSKLSCSNCHIVDGGVCPPKTSPTDPKPINEPWVPSTCGNGRLDDGELCDGNLINKTATVCPDGMTKIPNGEFKCLDTCRLVDISNACVPAASVVCGNGIIEGNEQCDGTEFSPAAVANLSCNDDEKVDLANAVCNNCQIQNACSPKINTNAGIMISEVVPHLKETATSIYFDGLAIELTNMSKLSSDVSSCSLALISQTKIEKKYPLSDLGISLMTGMETKVICSQSGEDQFEGVCNATISTDGILENMKGMVFLGIVCGDKDEITDLFNLNSFVQAVNNYGVDFTRECDATPVKETQNALLGVGWVIDSDTTPAPTYGLGTHCSNADANIHSCTYTVDRTTLTDRSQSISLALEINVPGLTDKTNKTDAAKDIRIQFVAGEVENNLVEQAVIHLIAAKPDTDWVNEDGIDRYIGTLRNWDTYDGFLSTDAGTYTLDAAISFDNGKTQVYCGPRGQIADYAVYDPAARNTLVVSYDDADTAKCGDGIISSSEVCDGNLFIEQALECEKANEVVVDRSKVKCSCSMLSTMSACASAPETCGNDTRDEGEVCDGIDMPDSAKVCPAGMNPIDNPEWTCSSTCLIADIDKACEFTCGNNKLDNEEVCDGSTIPDSAKVCPKNHVIKSDPVWTCDNKCSSVITDNACELACGNNKLDNNEICDGELFDAAAAEASCKDGYYASERASCIEGCKLDPAACIPNDNQLVFDEFLVLRDDKNKAVGLAIKVSYHGSGTFDVGSCNLSILNEKGGPAVENAFYYSFLQIAGTDQSKFEINSCSNLVFCSEPNASKTEYKNLFGDKCNAHLGGYDSSNNIISNLLLNYPSIDTLRISCGGNEIDFFDMAGLRKAIADGYSHGKLKDSDTRPWSGRTTVDLEKRFDLDKTVDLGEFPTLNCID